MSVANRGAGILLHYVTEAVRILTAFFMTPWLLRLLGQREYGLYQLAVSVIAWLGLINFGFGSSYLRSFSQYQAEKDETGLARLNGMFFLIFSLLAALGLLCGNLLAAFGELVFGSGLTEAELAQGERLLQGLALNLSLTLLNVPFDGYLAAREQFVYQKLLRLAQTALNPLLLLPLLLAGYGSESMVWISLLLSAAALAGNGFRCFCHLGMTISFRKLPFSQLRSLWQFAFFIFLNQLIDQINWSVDKLLLGRMAGTAAVAVYGVGAQLHAIYMQLSIGISSVFLPKVNRIAARTEDNGPLSRLMADVGRLQGMVLMLPLSGFLFFGRPFLALWAGDGYEKAYAVALLLMVPVTVPLMQNLGIEIQRARNAHHTRSLVYTCLALGNVLLSILLIPRWGPSGAAAGTAVSLILGNGLFMNWYYQKRLKLDMLLYWREIVRLIPVWLAACIGGAGISLVWKITGWYSFLGAAAAYSVLYCGLLWRLGLKPGEKQRLLSLLSKKKRGQA